MISVISGTLYLSFLYNSLAYSANYLVTSPGITFLLLVINSKTSLGVITFQNAAHAIAKYSFTFYSYTIPTIGSEVTPILCAN